MNMFHLFHKLRFVILRGKIKNNPYIGKKDSDGNYYYNEGDYGIRYRIIKGLTDKESIDWISFRRRIEVYEGGIEKAGKFFLKLYHYQGWLVFFRPSIVFFIAISSLIFYLGFIETEKAKIDRVKYVIASALGIGVEQVEYIGKGEVNILAQRIRAIDGSTEPVRYRFNPFAWLFSSETGSVSRWIGKPSDYIIHTVVYNERGDVWIKKEDTWRHGMISGTDIEWDSPQGTGIREGKVTGEEISVQDKKIYIKDK